MTFPEKAVRPEVLSDQKEFRVIPDILMILGQNESPTGRKTEIRKHSRQQLSDMGDIVRLKKVRLCRKLLPGPDIPAGRVALGKMAKSVQRHFAGQRVSSDTDLGVGTGFHEVGGIPPTSATLKQVIAARHFRVGPNTIETS